MASISTLTCQALPKMASIRNQGDAGANIGSILAAEVLYIAIVPFAVVEAALAMTGLLFLWVLLPFEFLLLDGDENLCKPVMELVDCSIKTVEEYGLPVLWSVATVVMNLLPVKLLETREEAEQFFCCPEAPQAQVAPIVQARPVVLIPDLNVNQRPVRTNAMTGFLAVRNN